MKIRTYRDEAGEWRWTAIAANGRTVADGGEGYKEIRDCHHGRQVAQQLMIAASWEFWADTKPEPFADVVWYDPDRRCKVLGFRDGDGNRMYHGRVPEGFEGRRWMYAPNPDLDLHLETEPQTEGRDA